MKRVVILSGVEWMFFVGFVEFTAPRGIISCHPYLCPYKREFKISQGDIYRLAVLVACKIHISRTHMFSSKPFC